MNTVHVRFQEVSLRSQKSLRCDGCGKRVTRTRTESQTLNPFNRRGDGEPKTEQDIRGELEVLLDRWALIPVVCKTCADNGRLWRVEYLAGQYITRTSDHYQNYTGEAHPSNDANRRIALVAAQSGEDAERYAAKLFFEPQP